MIVEKDTHVLLASSATKEEEGGKGTS